MMQKYLAILKQDGGCDYTIACGTKEIKFDAENAKDAAARLKTIIKEEYSSDEFKLSSLHLFEISHQYIVDINHWYKEFKIEKDNERENAVKKSELAELERLKKKYENS